jgi:hypothetical protein
MKMNKPNELEANVQNLVDAKLLNLDVTLASLLKGGALSGMDPWDVWCGNGWILRKWPGTGPIRINELESIRKLIQQEVSTIVGK